MLSLRCLATCFIVVFLSGAASVASADQTSSKQLELELQQWLQQRQPQQFQGEGQQPLNYFSHLAATESDIALIYLHGIESHSGWFHLVASRLAGQGYDVYLPDRRGSGTNRAEMGLEPGHADSADQLTEDLNQLIDQVTPNYKKRYLIGLSWGGKLAMHYSMQYPEKIDGVILITPGLVAKVDYSLWQKLGIGFCALLCSEAAFPVPIQAPMFTDDPLFLSFIRNDSLRNTTASASFLWATNRIDKAINKGIESFDLPISLHLAEHDEIVDNDGIVSLLRRSRSNIDQTDYPDQIHSLQFETPDQLSRLIGQWLIQQGERNAN
ncbi:alpha/beta fold hydrolase [Corallincola platygyrae]|uniref:Alpha/beta fold hydrolase n=1 Tax=Corallincola platygyrae TaxID=1193278 RepID=A0ABW4XMY3_9GAMM